MKLVCDALKVLAKLVVVAVTPHAFSGHRHARWTDETGFLSSSFSSNSSFGRSLVSSKKKALLLTATYSRIKQFAIKTSTDLAALVILSARECR